MKSYSCRISLILVALFVLLPSCKNKDEDYLQQQTIIRASVIIDSDMVESFDDGIAFMMLLGTDSVQVRGLTTETTNVWAPEALAHGIRLGELCGGKAVTYIAGAQFPLRSGRFDSLDQEIDAAPGEDADWRGAISYPEVTDWRTSYISKYGRQPEIKPSTLEASEYIYQQIMSAPGKITILAIGKCTNIAKAILAHPEMAKNAKEIIYMGGAVYCLGNTTTYAEMNFLYDPEAAAICLRAPFPKQTLVSLDVCNTVTMDRNRLMTLYNSVHSATIRDLIRSNYPYPDFEANPSAVQYVWDLISAAVAIDANIITKYDDVRLDVDDNPDSPTYGKSFVSNDSVCQIVRVPKQINQERFWEIVLDGMSKH